MKLLSPQRKAFYYAQTVQHPAFFMTMRSRKTILTLKDLIYNDVFPALVCCPLSSVFGWSEDAEKIGMETAVIIGTKRQKQKAIIPGKSLCVTNKEFFRSVPELINLIDFQAVVLDESTCIKNCSTKKRPILISDFYHKNFRDVKRRYILTGTPEAGHQLDYYGQLKFLDPSIFPFKTFWDFRRYYFYESWEHNWQLKSDKKLEFYERLNKYCYFLSLNDLRKSIGKDEMKTQRTVRTFDFKPETKKIYQNLKQNFIVKMGETTCFGFNNILQQSIYLAKLCSGFITIDPETKESKLVDDSKYKLLMEVLEEIPDYKVIILCSFYDEINTIEKFFKQSGKKYTILTGSTKPSLRGSIISSFQKGDTQYIIANIECLKFGVTLSSADLTIKFSSLGGPESIEQAEMRGTDVYRDDQVDIIHLIAKGSIEEYFYSKIGKKESNKKLVNDLIEYLKKD